MQTIKILKIGNEIKTNFPARFIDEQGNEQWNIPTDLEELRACVIDTINWKAGNEATTTIGDMVKLVAANSKAIAMLVKVIDKLGPDLSELTENERQAYEVAKELAQGGYADSLLLTSALNTAKSVSLQASELEEQAKNAASIDELIAILNKL